MSESQTKAGNQRKFENLKREFKNLNSKIKMAVIPTIMEDPNEEKADLKRT